MSDVLNDWNNPSPCGEKSSTEIIIRGRSIPGLVCVHAHVRVTQRYKLTPHIIAAVTFADQMLAF